MSTPQNNQNFIGGIKILPILVGVAFFLIVTRSIFSTSPADVSDRAITESPEYTSLPARILRPTNTLKPTQTPTVVSTSTLTATTTLTITITFTPTMTPTPTARVGSELGAISACKEWVTQYLFQPHTAKFPWIDYDVRSEIWPELDIYVWYVRSYVDSQNVFGATIRNECVCICEYIPDKDDSINTYRLSSLVIDGRTMYYAPQE